MPETNRLGAVRITRFIAVTYDVPLQAYMNMTPDQIREWETNEDKTDWREQLSLIDMNAADVRQENVSVEFVVPEPKAS